MTDSTVPPIQAEETKQDEKSYTYKEIHSTDLADINTVHKDEQAGGGEQVPDASTKSGDSDAASSENKPDASQNAVADDAKTPDVKTPDKEPAPVIDPEVIAKRTAEEVVKSILGDDATKEEKKDLQDDLETSLKEQAWVKENRNPTYAEMTAFLAKYTTDAAVKRIKEDLEKEVIDEEEKEKQEKIQTEEQVKSFHTKWDTQFKQLESLGHIPSGELGKEARGKIYEMMKGRIVNGRPTDDIMQVFLEDYKPAMDQLQKQKTAPVAGTRRGGSTTTKDSYSYAEIHGKDLGEFVK